MTFRMLFSVFHIERLAGRFQRVAFVRWRKCQRSQIQEMTTELKAGFRLTIFRPIWNQILRITTISSSESL